MELATEDYQLIRLLRSPEIAVLEKVDALRLNDRDGTIVVFCSDCDQSWDLVTYLAALQQTQREEPRLHLFGRHGGPLRIPKNSPINKPGRATDVDLLEEIGEAMGLKGLSTIKLIAHAPCGKAHHHHLGARSTLLLLNQAHERVVARFPNATVVSLLHVDYSSRPDRDGKKKKCIYRIVQGNLRAGLAA